MNTREKKLLQLAALIFALYFLPFQIGPKGMEFARAHLDYIENTKAEIKRIRQLLQQNQAWRDKHVHTLAEQTRIENGLLQGASPEIITARMQRALKDTAQNAGARVVKMEVPELNATGNLVLVTQIMEVETDSAALMKLVEGLRDNPVFMPVTLLEARSMRQKILQVSLKVIGFSQAIVPAAPAEAVSPPAPATP